MSAMATPTPRDGLEAALTHVGDRWSLLVIDSLMGGARRFGELQDQLPGIATNVLSQRLRHLEREGIVVAHPYSSHPPRYAYQLSASGRELGGALLLLAGWGSRQWPGDGDLDAGPHHPACGTPLEARWYCPTCDQALHQDGTDAGPVQWV